MKTKLLIVILVFGLFSACGTQATEVPASTPTDQPATPTQTVAATSAPTDTTIPPTEVVPATEPAGQGATVSFANDILPIFNSRCANCHGGNRTEEGLNVLSHASLLQGSSNGSVLVAGNADGSLLVEQIVSQEMPKRGPKLTPAQTQLIIDWINQGALNN